MTAPDSTLARTASPKRDRAKGLRRLVGRALLALGVLGALAASVMALRPQRVGVDTAQVSVGLLQVVIHESGMTRVKDRYKVSAPVTGTLSRLSLEPGDAVKVGDPLAEIAPALSPLLDSRTRAEAEARLSAALSAQAQAHAQLERAKWSEAQAEQELARQKKLAGSGATTGQELEQAEFASRMRSQESSSAEFAEKVAAEEVRIAKVTLGRDGERTPGGRHVDVLSPISGLVLRVYEKSAGVVSTGTPLVEIGDPTALEAVVDLLTTDAVRVQPGADVVFEGWGGDQPLTGRVRRIEPSGTTRPSALGIDEQRVNIIVAIDSPPAEWRTLGDGFRVEARLVLWRGEGVRKVPQGAIFRHGDGWATFRLDSGIARLTPVAIGHRGEKEVEIVSGLEPGATVISHPGDRVKDGVRVRAR